MLISMHLENSMMIFIFLLKCGVPNKEKIVLKTNQILYLYDLNINFSIFSVLKEKVCLDIIKNSKDINFRKF